MSLDEPPGKDPGNANGGQGAESNTKDNASSSAGHSLGKDLPGSLPGTNGTSGGAWMGSQDFCLLLQMLADLDGAGGSRPGKSTNSMFPPHVNCHFFPPGPTTDPEKQAGGGCPPVNNVSRPPSNRKER